MENIFIGKIGAPTECSFIWRSRIDSPMLLKLLTNFKLGISGLIGAGKTTLATSLAKTMGELKLTD